MLYGEFVTIVDAAVFVFERNVNVQRGSWLYDVRDIHPRP
jgi:hypothetical protein